MTPLPRCLPTCHFTKKSVTATSETSTKHSPVHLYFFELLLLEPLPVAKVSSADESHEYLPSMVEWLGVALLLADCRSFRVAGCESATKSVLDPGGRETDRFSTLNPAPEARKGSGAFRGSRRFGL